MKSFSARRSLCLFTLVVCAGLLVNCGSGNSSAVQLEEITVTPANPVLAKGENVGLHATGHYSNGQEMDVTGLAAWDTKNASIATVSGQGNVQAVGEGGVLVTATYHGVTGNASVTVGAPVLMEISVSPNSSTLPKGETEQLTATGKFSDGSQTNLTQTATWTSSGNTIVAVTSAGSVQAMATGSATITATSGSVSGAGAVSVTQAVLRSITIAPNQQSLAVGQSGQLTATGNYSDGSTQNLTQSVTWASSAAGIASVSATGAVNAASVGAATITATTGSVSGNAAVSVTKAALVGITVSPNALTLPVGETQQLRATGSYSDGSTQDLTQSATWSCSGTSGTVTATGMVKGSAAGSAQVTATSGTISGSAVLTVSAAALLGITVNPSSASLPLGESQQLTATGNYSDGSTQNLTQSVTWSSSASSVASVSAGTVQAAAIGSATITAASGSVSGNAAITVGAAVLQSLAITPNPSTLPLGETESLTATGQYSDGTTQNLTQTVTWVSSASSIASVTSTGSVHGSAIGSANITATSGSIAGSAAVTIAKPALLSITVAPSSVALPLGESKNLTATGSYSDGSTQDLTQTATWTSSAISIASVGTGGVVQAAALGTATITATSASIAGSAAITVKPPALLTISVGPNPLTLPLGEQQQMSATGQYSDGSTQNLTQTVSWSCPSPTIASISGLGTVQGVAAGTTTVTATLGSIAGNAAVTIQPPALLSITVAAAQISLPIGQSEQLVAIGTYSDGSTKTLTQSVAWNSDSPAVASVSSVGSALAIAEGTATMSAKLGTVVGAGILVVTPSGASLNSLDVVPANVSLVMNGKRQLRAKANWSDGTTEDVTALVTWTSTPSGIVGMDPTGVASALQIGSTTVFATYNGATGTAAITVGPLMLVNYFSETLAQASGIDGTLNLSNPGPGSICAMIYVFDSNQELNECCGCSISDGGLRTLSLLNDLTNNPLTGQVPAAGTIAIIPSAAGTGSQCNAASLTPSGVVTAWSTSVQGDPVNGFQQSETTFSPTTLVSANASTLAQECNFIQNEGSGSGICTCGFGGQ